MSTELAALRSGLAPRRSAVGSLLALPVADVVAMLACFVAGGLLNFSYQNVTEERTLILALLTAGSLVVFHHFGHYSRRRQFWQELGDIAMVAAVALHLRCRPALPPQGQLLAPVGAHQLGAGGAGGAAGAPAGEADRARARPLAAADGDHRHRPQRPRDRRRLRCARQASGLPGEGVPRPLRPTAGPQESGRGRRARSRSCRSTQEPAPAGLAGPAAHGGGARARRDARPRGAHREPVLLPWRHRRDLAVEGPADQQHPGQPLLLARHPLPAHPQQPGTALAAADQAGVRPGGGRGPAAVPGAPAGADRAQDPAGRRRRGDLRPHPGRPARPAVPVLQVPHHGGELGRGPGRAPGQRPRGAGGVGPRPQAPQRPPDHRRWAASCARPAWTSCRSCSTWSAAR